MTSGGPVAPTPSERCPTCGSTERDKPKHWRDDSIPDYPVQETCDDEWHDSAGPLPTTEAAEQPVDLMANLQRSLGLPERPTTEAQRTDDLVETARRLADAATPGPWRWAWPGSDSPELMGVKGDENYSWEEEVLTANHNGECGCRSACHLDLTVSDADAEFIAASRSLVPALVAELVGLRSELAAERAKTLGDHMIAAYQARPKGDKLAGYVEQEPDEDDLWVAAGAEFNTIRAARDAAVAELAGLRERITTLAAQLEDYRTADAVAALLGETIEGRVEGEQQQ